MDAHHPDPDAAAHLSRRLAFGLLALALAALSCTPAAGPSPAPQDLPESSPTPSSPEPVLIYSIGEPGALLPGDVVDPNGLLVVDALFDSLTRESVTGQVLPAAAETWTADARLQTWTFTLRSGATFHDGRPVTAEDFRAAWQRAVDSDAGYHLQDVVGYADAVTGASPLAGLEVPDQRTLQVRLEEPFADFPSVVGHPALGPLPPVDAADLEGFAERPVGNGPFRMTEAWARDQYVRVESFPDWNNGPGSPGVGVIEFRIEDPDDGWVAFQQGRRDVAPLPAGTLGEARDRFGRLPRRGRGPGVVELGGGTLYFLGMNVRRSPFDQIEVRQALSLAIDRVALAAGVREGNAAPARSAVPHVVPDARLLPCDNCVEDERRARRLFRAAGVDRLQLWINEGGGHERIADLVRRDLEEVGVDLDVRPVRAQAGAPSLDAYLNVLEDGPARLFRFGWSLDYPTLDNALTPLLRSDLAGRLGAANYGRYRSATVDVLLRRARATADVRDRRRLYEQAEDVAIDQDQAIVPLLTLRTSVVISDRIAGFVPGPLGAPDLAGITLIQAP